MPGALSGTKIDLIESSGADLPPVGTTRLIRKGGVTQQSVDGAAFAALGGGGGGSFGQAQALTRAQALLGPTIVNVFGTDFDTTNWIATPAPVGTATTALSTTERGGVLNMASGATGSSSVIVKPLGSAGLLINPTTELWYSATRVRQATAMDANTYNSVGVQGTGTTCGIAIGALGNRSTANFWYELYNNSAAVVANASLGVALDQVYHLFETWGDTVNIYIAADGVLVATIPIPASVTNPIFPLLFVSNGATAANRQQNVDYSYICTGRP